MNEEHDKIHALAIKRFERVQSKERDQRELAIEDLNFAQAEDGQWSDDAKGKRSNRPRFTINRVASAVDQLISDQRQNRSSIKVRPVSGGATEEVAKTLGGIIRNIEDQSKAARAYDGAFDEVVNGGFGGWRVTTEYEEDGFGQSISIEPILTATTSLWFDDAAIKYDKSDAMFAFYTVDMPKDEHKERFPDSAAVDWSQNDYTNNSCEDWGDSDTVRVAEYWIKTEVTKNLGLLSDGRVIDLDDEKDALNELEKQGIEVVKQRKAKGHKVEMYLMDGSGILEGPKEWAGKYIPLIPMYGRQSHIEGKTYTRGIVRFAKDANRIYNYATSTAVEASALSPKDPIWMTPAQQLGHEPQLANFNTSNSPFLSYNPDPLAPGIPQRGGAPAVQSAVLQQVQQAGMDLYHTTGIQPPNVAVGPELRSGKAIIAQEKQGDRGSFVFNDNLSKSVNYTGEILIDLIPRIMDTPQQVRIMQQDGETENIEINTVNETVVDGETGNEVLVNDLSIGKYDITTETGPAFATQRQESAQQLIELFAASPQLESIALDLVAKDLPILETKELTKRVRKLMIKDGRIDPNEQEIKDLGLDQPQEPDPQQQAITENIAMQSADLQADIESKDAKTAETIIKAQQATVDTYSKMMDAFKKQVEMGVPLSEPQRQMMIKQADIITEGQQSLDEGPNSEQAADLINQAVANEEFVSQQSLNVAQPNANSLSN